jgi:type II secretory pathway component HofQ
MELAEVMELIGRQAGTNILVDPKVRERVTISLRDVPWREAVDLIARMTRCDVEERKF